MRIDFLVRIVPGGERILIVPVKTTIVQRTRKIRKTGSSSGRSGARAIPEAIVALPCRNTPSAIPKTSHTKKSEVARAVMREAMAGSCQKKSLKR